MATLLGNEVERVDTLKGLMELELDAVSAYETAIERLEDPGYRSVLREFLQDHHRHLRELGPLIAARGEQPPEGTDIKGLLTRGRVVIRQLIGDAGILTAMRSNEEETHQAYGQAAEREDLSPEVRLVLLGALSDERRHRAWLEGTLQRLEAPQDQIEDTTSQPRVL